MNNFTNYPPPDIFFGSQSLASSTFQLPPAMNQQFAAMGMAPQPHNPLANPTWAQQPQPKATVNDATPSMEQTHAVTAESPDQTGGQPGATIIPLTAKQVADLAKARLSSAERRAMFFFQDDAVRAHSNTMSANGFRGKATPANLPLRSFMMTSPGVQMEPAAFNAMRANARDLAEEHIIDATASQRIVKHRAVINQLCDSWEALNYCDSDWKSKVLITKQLKSIRRARALAATPAAAVAPSHQAANGTEDSNHASPPSPPAATPTNLDQASASTPAAPTPHEVQGPVAMSTGTGTTPTLSTPSGDQPSVQAQNLTQPQTHTSITAINSHVDVPMSLTPAHDPVPTPHQVQSAAQAQGPAQPHSDAVAHVGVPLPTTPASQSNHTTTGFSNPSAYTTPTGGPRSAASNRPFPSLSTMTVDMASSIETPATLSTEENGPQASTSAAESTSSPGQSSASPAGAEPQTEESVKVGKTIETLDKQTAIILIQTRGVTFKPTARVATLVKMLLTMHNAVPFTVQEITAAVNSMELDVESGPGQSAVTSAVTTSAVRSSAGDKGKKSSTTQKQAKKSNKAKGGRPTKAAVA